MKFSYPRLSAVLGDSAVPLVLRVAKTVKMKKRKKWDLAQLKKFLFYFNLFRAFCYEDKFAFFKSA
jgi:hypothetical protein